MGNFSSYNYSETETLLTGVITFSYEQPTATITGTGFDILSELEKGEIILYIDKQKYAEAVISSDEYLFIQKELIQFLDGKRHISWNYTYPTLETPVSKNNTFFTLSELNNLRIIPKSIELVKVKNKITSLFYTQDYYNSIIIKDNNNNIYKCDADFYKIK